MFQRPKQASPESVRAPFEREARAFGLDRRLAAVLIVSVLVYWTDILRILFPGADSAPSLLFRLLHFVFYAIFAGLLLTVVDRVRMACVRAPLMIAFMAMPMLSVLWSAMPTETLQRAIAVTGSSLLGLYLAVALAPRNSVRLVAFAAFLAGIGSLFAIAAVPAVGIMTVEHPGAWAGLYGHKNGLGQMASLGALLALAVVLADGAKTNAWALISMALNTVLVIGSRSLTALILLVVVAGALVCVGRFVRFIVDQAVVLALIVIPLALIAIASFRIDDVFVLLAAAGKDGNLSSRLPMWQALVPFIEEKFWLGWGYEAFWHEANYAVRIIEAKLFFRPFYAHNGIIELWLNIGLVGVLMFAVLFATFVKRTLAHLYGHPARPETLAALAFAVIFLLQNISESTILMRHSMSWTMFIVLYLLLALDQSSDRRMQSTEQHQKLLHPEPTAQPTPKSRTTRQPPAEPSPFSRPKAPRRLTVE